MAEREEADEVANQIDADPLSFKWGLPIPL